jgi:glycosyltransferase involved in cell wall biosynthesis
MVSAHESILGFSHVDCAGERITAERMDVSLIITTYNWPGALAVTLQSVLRQTRPPDEVIIADDGSSSKTAETVMRILGSARLNWRHAWHPDEGIRQARVKNLGVKFSQGDYLIFIDHDVVLHPEFVSDHCTRAEKGLFLQGKRCFLPETYTIRLLQDGFVKPPSPFLKGMENRKNAFRLPGIVKFLFPPKSSQLTLRGCNLSMARSDFLMVDGYDETFDQLWGREDSDLCYRLFHSGVKVKNLWFSALQYHLHHKVIKRTGEDRLDKELRLILDEKRKKALKGFSQLSSEGRIVASSAGSRS